MAIKTNVQDMEIGDVILSSDIKSEGYFHECTGANFYFVCIGRDGRRGLGSKILVADRTIDAIREQEAEELIRKRFKDIINNSKLEVKSIEDIRPDKLSFILPVYLQITKEEKYRRVR